MDWELFTQILWEAPLPLVATFVFSVACVVAAFVLVGKEINKKETHK